jgi:hypothetical protein
MELIVYCHTDPLSRPHIYSCIKVHVFSNFIDDPIPLAIHPISSHSFVVITQSGIIFFNLRDIRLYRYTPTDTIVLLSSLSTLIHITASSFSESNGLLFINSIGDLYRVSISISHLKSNCIARDLGIGISAAALDNDIILVLQDGSYRSINYEGVSNIGAIIDSSQDYILARDFKGRYNICQRKYGIRYRLDIERRAGIDPQSLLSVWTWNIDDDWYLTACGVGSSHTFIYADGVFLNTGIEFGRCVGVFGALEYVVFVGTRKVVLFGRDDSNGFHKSKLIFILTL